MKSGDTVPLNDKKYKPDDPVEFGWFWAAVQDDPQRVVATNARLPEKEQWLCTYCA